MAGYALLDCARSGFENMALDQRLLEAASELQCLFVRVYQWSEPTVSLGYFQPYAERDAHRPSNGLATVRRSTGGGAIVHHHDWTYCVAMPVSFLSRIDNDSGARTGNVGAAPALYDCIHDEVVDFLNQAGFAANKWNRTCSPATAQNELQRQFLCFERRSCGDIELGGHKVMGSAQRRGNQAILQHGSLLLATSPFAPNLTGLAHWQAGESAIFNFGIFLHRIASTLESATRQELNIITALEELPFRWHWPIDSKYAQDEWTQRL